MPKAAIDMHLTKAPTGTVTSTSTAQVEVLASDHTGRDWDAETGMYFYRARYYSPTLARFTSEDPIRFASGDVNFYRHVGNNPTNYVDPLGLMFADEGNFAGVIGASENVTRSEITVAVLASMSPLSATGAVVAYPIVESLATSVLATAMLNQPDRTIAALNKLIDYLNTAGRTPPMIIALMDKLKKLLEELEDLPSEEGEACGMS